MMCDQTDELYSGARSLLVPAQPRLTQPQPHSPTVQAHTAIAPPTSLARLSPSGGPVITTHETNPTDPLAGGWYPSAFCGVEIEHFNTFGPTA